MDARSKAIYTTESFFSYKSNTDVLKTGHGLFAAIREAHSLKIHPFNQSMRLQPL